MLIPGDLLKLTPRLVAANLEGLTGEDLIARQDQPADASDKTKFFDFGKGEENAIVRSFKNVQGKGTAGFITSMNFDWNEALQNGKWDTGTHGSRAPQICSIDISFTVIHDIPPGLDSNGFNRAPVYPTGRVMNTLAGDVYDSIGIAAENMENHQDKSKNNGGK